MLKSLMVRAVGPAPEMTIDFAERINVITGDNGLGKSFLLDVAWWALTRTWAGTPALPTDPSEAMIRYVIKGRKGSAEPVTSRYRAEEQEWPGEPKRPAMPGVVVYMRVDGGFSVWDPARNYWRKDRSDRPPAYHFDHQEVWDGLRINGVSVSEGLERDWVSWQKGREPQFLLLERVLQKLSPPDVALTPGPPKRVFLGEGFDRPTLLIGDAVVPVAIASAGIRRILALAYLLVWAWHEHRVAAALLGTEPDTRMALLIDEPETHLHPAWQRRVIPAVVEAVRVLHEEHKSATQILIATHSPLVLASLEPFFDIDRDALFHLRFEAGYAVLEPEPWAKQGDASQWLVSDVFNMRQARSAEAEQAIEAAEAFMREDLHMLPEGLRTREQINARLRTLLAPHDPFWARWLTRTEPALRVSARA
ncbi:MAG TPA: ATP-binding protein [Thermoanaerobaculia bacterium]|nr:ATP-binding protein [Thermoanaerobaculia bacterium]